MSITNLSITDLADLDYIILGYTGTDGKPHEIKTTVKFIGSYLISLYIQTNSNANIPCPQKVSLKFLIDDILYTADTVLKEIKKTNNLIYFSVMPPEQFKKQQNRKYYRIDTRRSCVLVSTDKNDCTNAYLAQSVNLSGCGILINDLERMNRSSLVTVSPKEQETHTIVLFLETKNVLKLSAKYVRHETVNGSNRYAFQFLNMKAKDIDTICKYVTDEQVRQLGLAQKFK